MLYCYKQDSGFSDAPNVLRDYTQSYYVSGVSPALVRRALNEALIHMLTELLGEDEMSDIARAQWTKVYRVMEQAIIIDILNL